MFYWLCYQDTDLLAHYITYLLTDSLSGDCTGKCFTYLLSDSLLWLNKYFCLTEELLMYYFEFCFMTSLSYWWNLYFITWELNLSFFSAMSNWVTRWRMIELIRFDGWINNFKISNLVRIFSIYPWGSMGMIFLLLVACQTALPTN